MQIRDYRPVLDLYCELIEEVAAVGEGEVFVPAGKEFAGLAVDLEIVHYILTPKTDRKSNLEIKHAGNCTSIRFQNNKYPLTFVFDDTRRESLEIPEELHHISLIACNDEEIRKGDGVMSAQCQQPRLGKPERDVIFRQIFGRAGIELPEEKPAVLELSYMNPSPFPLYLSYQNFPRMHEAVGKISKKAFVTYAVSAKKEHALSERAWKRIESPVFFDAWGQLLSQAMQIISGYSTETNIDARYMPNDADAIKRHLPRAKEGMLNLINTFVEDSSSSSYLHTYCIPQEYAGLYLKKPFRTLAYFLNPSSLNPNSGIHPFAKKALGAVNEYRKMRGLKDLTLEQLCIFGQSQNSRAHYKI